MSEAKLDELVSRLRRQADEIACVGIPGWGNTMQQAADAIERLRIGHERYETVRRMTPHQFGLAFELNTSTGKPFDQLIDELRPFIRPNAKPTGTDVEGTA